MIPSTWRWRSSCSSRAHGRCLQTPRANRDRVAVPPPLRYLLAYDRDLCSAVLGFFVNAIARHLRSIAKHELGLNSVRLAHPGTITAVQRFGSAINLNLSAYYLA